MLFQYPSVFTFLLEFVKNAQEMRLIGGEPENQAGFYREIVKKILAIMSPINLPLSVRQCEKMLEYIDSYPTQLTDNPKIESMFDELAERIKDELLTQQFFHVKPPLVQYCLENQFSQQAVNRFPSAQVDMEEAGWCYGLQRPTATVFHLMRVVEHGLMESKNALGITDFKQSWGDVLKSIEGKIGSEQNRAQKDKYKRLKERFYSIKDAWRNPTMHIERIYNQEEAKEVFDTVVRFMDALALDLP